MVAHPEVGFSLMDTFESDMAAQTNGFNDRVYVQVPIPADMRIGYLAAHAATNVQPVNCRVVGHAVETWKRSRSLHVQVDLPSTGYQQGPIRAQFSQVRLTIRAKASPNGR
jgi:hypothetical protein